MAVKYYNSQIEKHAEILKKYRAKRNIFTTLKVIAFCALIYLIYKWATTSNNLLLVFCGLLVVALVVLTLIDNRLLHIIHIASKHIELLNNEIAALKGDNSAFGDGAKYRSMTHPYSHDLDIFGNQSLFQHLNRTVTSGGADLLASYLANPSKSKSEIEARQNGMKELSKLSDFRFEFLATGAHYHTPMSDATIIDKWRDSGYFFDKRWMRNTLYGANAVVIVAWIAVILGYLPFIIAFALSIMQMMASMLLTKRVSKHQRSMDRFLKAFSNYTYLVKLIDAENFSSDILKDVKNQLFGDKSAVVGLSKLKSISYALDQRFNLLVFMLMDGLYMKSIHSLIALDRWKVKYSGNIGQWIESVNKVDTLISMANFAYNNRSYTIPVIDNTTKITAKGLCHPLLKSPRKVKNDFEVNTLHQLRVITGANMAGKSTFLRSVGINLILASMGCVVYSDEFRFTPMELFTSMRTTDDLSQGSSYFHAELMRLKQLITTAEKSDGVFIILDEILKGTNSVDKLNGSRMFLKRILPLPISGIIATHDLALGELHNDMPNNFVNLCFEIVHEGENIIYDYKLKEGVSQTMNATILLSQLGLI